MRVWLLCWYIVVVSYIGSEGLNYKQVSIIIIIIVIKYIMIWSVDVDEFFRQQVWTGVRSLTLSVVLYLLLS